MISYPYLYASRLDGKTQIWWMDRNDNMVRSNSAIYDVDTKIIVETSLVTSTWRVVEGTNDGKVNMRTPAEQADFAIKRNYRIRIENGAVYNLDDEPMFKEKISPMLADKYKVDKVYSNVFSQPKIDGCLEANSLIQTDKGVFTIKEVVENNIGNYVLTFNHRSNKTTKSKILNRMKNLKDINGKDSFKWVRIRTKKGKELILTENHRVWVSGPDVWRETKDLNLGDKIITS